MTGEPRARTFLYQYGDDEKSREVEIDLLEQIPIPREGTIIERKGKLWNVVEVSVQEVIDEAHQVPVVLVFLSLVEIG